MGFLLRRRSPSLLESETPLRIKHEFCLVLRVSSPAGMLSRFISDADRSFAEGRERCEEVLRALRDAGLTVKVKKHLAKDGCKLLLVFLRTDTARLQQEAQRLSIERWLQEEGISGMMGSSVGSQAMMQQPREERRPTMRVVRVGGLHYFAPANGESPASQAEQQQAQQQQQQPASSQFAPSSAFRVELLDHILYSPASQGGAGLEELQKADRRGTIQHVFPLHDHRFNRRLRRKARYLNPFCGRSLDVFLEEVRAQFGEKVRCVAGRLPPAPPCWPPARLRACRPPLFRQGHVASRTAGST